MPDSYKSTRDFFELSNLCPITDNMNYLHSHEGFLIQKLVTYLSKVHN